MDDAGDDTEFPRPWIAMMRVLNLDLDFFLSDVHCWTSAANRLDPKRFIPWAAADVRQFLEQQCGLDRSKPLPGRMVVKHDEVFRHWRTEIDTGILSVPFDVVHVDSHADLGLGDASWKYIVTELLGLPANQRTAPTEGGVYGMNEGNYLAFALACRWIRSLTYVPNPKTEEDLQEIFFRGCEHESGFIELCRYGTTVSPEQFFGDKKPGPLSVEPAVPFARIPGPQYRATGTFDRIYVSQSPGYTPSASDALLPVIAEYIVES